MEILIFVLLSVFLCVIWGIFFETRIIKTEKLELEIRNLPQSFKRKKILHLTDIHSKNFGGREKKILEIVKKAKPDYIFITGDFLNWEIFGFGINLESCQEFWKKLSADSAGKVFAVFGNHDYKSFNFRKMKAFLSESGIRFLENETVRIENDGAFINIVSSRRMADRDLCQELGWATSTTTSSTTIAGHWARIRPVNASWKTTLPRR